ncbi:MAG TPA: hypothetical protein P5314_07895, partial [Tetrasphaera sp.]|nr:hypothetical protein [Tetrasphaera sp.]
MPVARLIWCSCAGERGVKCRWAGTRLRSGPPDSGGLPRGSLLVAARLLAVVGATAAAAAATLATL